MSEKQPSHNFINSAGKELGPKSFRPRTDLNLQFPTEVPITPNLSQEILVRVKN